MPRLPDSSEWELPQLRASVGFENEHKHYLKNEVLEFFDVKFYPYNPQGSPPVFALVSKKHVLIGRITQSRESPVEVIRIIRDLDPDADSCACTWAKDPETGRPLLCVTGMDTKIKVYDVNEGTLVRTLVGHGGPINDLATSPANPSIIASAANDTTVRIWSLAAVHEKQPCVVLLGGEGHAWDLLSVAYHATGRYIISAGHDQVINLWTIPDIPDKHMDTPVVVHYPHFSTWSIHSDVVDCIAFLGDCILSRACHEDTIVLWRIEGFNSQDPPPLPSDAPTLADSSKLSRSAFVQDSSAFSPVLYTRLVEFHATGCENQFYMRFSVFQAPGRHPVLAFCNVKSKVFFWDLERLTTYHDFMTALKDPKRDKSAPPLARPPWLQAKGPKKAEGTSKLLREPADKDSLASADATPDPEAKAGVGSFHPDVIANWESMYGISQPHNHPLKPHKTVVVAGEKENFMGRQVAWSPDGAWCVVAGNLNRAAFFQRWAKEKGSHAAST